MLIGITGGIGSGKSTVARALKRMGYPVYDTDSEAKRIITENAEVRRQMELLFGEEVYDGKRYRTELVAQRVFADKSLLKKLNAIVHPAVCRDLRQWLTQQGSTICFVECAIIWESGVASECDKIAEVTAPLETRIERTIRRDGTSREAVARRIASQMPDEERLARANIILRNDDSTPIEQLAELLISQI